MRLQKLTMGKDAQVSCLIKFLHPQNIACECFPNANNTQHIDNFVVLSEVKKVRRKDVMVVVVASPSILKNGQPLELHAVERNLKIIKEGSSDYTSLPLHHLQKQWKLQ